MTCSTIGQALGCHREAVPFRGMKPACVSLQPETDFVLIRGARREHSFARSERFLGVAVAVETPAHERGFPFCGNEHLIDLAVALAAGDAFVHMGAVIETTKSGRSTRRGSTRWAFR